MRDATQALTVIAEIDHQQRPELERRLAIIARDPEANPLFRPMDLPDTHFMRFVIIDDPELPALLAWESNHDRSKRTYLSEVLAAVPGLARVFECCVGFPGAGAQESRLH